MQALLAGSDGILAVTAGGSACTIPALNPHLPLLSNDWFCEPRGVRLAIGVWGNHTDDSFAATAAPVNLPMDIPKGK